MTNQSKWLGDDFESMSFSDEKAKCLFCDYEFDLSFKLNRSKPKIDQLRKHLVLEHQFIISDINDIDDLNGYLAYWRRRISEIADLKSICAVIKTNSKPDDVGESVDYNMLCPDVLPEDRCLRQELKLAKLNYLTKVQEVERNETDFERSCLFCRKLVLIWFKASLKRRSVEAFINKALSLSPNQAKPSPAIERYCSSI